MNTTLPDFPIMLVFAENQQFQYLQISLAKYMQQQNKGLILYFYPKDNTAGCSTQAEDFTSYQQEFAKLGYIIIGVSRDSVKSHEKFITNKQLSIALISDTDEKLCQYFAVIGEKKLYGKVVQGVVRSTLVFNKQGQLIHELRNIRAKGHAENLKNLLSYN